MFQMKRDSRTGFGSSGDSAFYFEDRKEALRSIEEKKKKNAIPGSLRKLVRH